MKKIILTFLIIFVSTTIFAQEKGFHLTLGGSVGQTNFKYKILNGGVPKPDLGFGASIGVEYYFNYYLGIATGVNLSIFNTKSFFEDEKFFFPGLQDKEKDSCDITVRLRNWTESQKTYFLDIPLLLKFQYKWGKKERHGFYLGAGIKLQLPISSSTYEIPNSDYDKLKGKVSVYAHYPKLGLTLGEEGFGIELPWIGYGSTENILWKGKNQLKMGCAIVGEAGFLIGLSNRVDLTLGVSADYGFVNIKKNTGVLLEVTKDRTAQDGKVGEIVGYNGILNSNRTDKILPVSVRGTIGLKIKLGKLKERDDVDDQTKKLAEILSNMETGHGKRDTIIVNPTVLPIYLPYNGDGQEGEPAGARRYPANYDDGDGSASGSGAGNAPRVRKGSPLPQAVIDDLEESIYFPLDKSTLDQVAIEVLDRKVAQMKKYPYATISVVGHTCDLGSSPHNDELSLNRATAAKYYMISKGIKPSRIEIIPMGKHYPTHPNTTEDSRRLNRRVDFIFND